MAQRRAIDPLQVFRDIWEDTGSRFKLWPDTCEGRRDKAKWDANRAYNEALRKASAVKAYCEGNAQDSVSRGLCASDYGSSVSAATLAHIAAIEAADALCTGSSQAFTSVSTSRQELQEQLQKQLGVQLNPSRIIATKIELAIKREQQKQFANGPRPIFGLATAGLAIPIGEVFCYGAACLGTVAICIANNEPIRCPGWDEFNDDVALWTAYLALLLVCQAALDVAELRHSVELMIAQDGADVAAADAKYQLALDIYEACVKLAYDEYIEKGGKPRNERQ